MTFSLRISIRTFSILHVRSNICKMLSAIAAIFSVIRFLVYFELKQFAKVRWCRLDTCMTHKHGSVLRRCRITSTITFPIWWHKLEQKRKRQKGKAKRMEKTESSRQTYLGQVYPAELEIKDTTENTTSASYLDLLLSIGRDGQLHTSIYDKRDDFNFHITNFPFLSSNIPSSPAYGVFISQLIRYARACSSYECFILRARRLSSKLLKQGYLVERLKSSFRKFYGRYGDLTEQYGVTLSRMLNDILTLDQQWLSYRSDFPPISWPYTELDLHRIMSGFHGAFATGLASQQGTLTLPDTWFRPPFWDLLMLQLLRPNSSNLPCLYSTFHLEYPLVLSRFCFVTNVENDVPFTLFA